MMIFRRPPGPPTQPTSHMSPDHRACIRIFDDRRVPPDLKADYEAAVMAEPVAIPPEMAAMTAAQRRAALDVAHQARTLDDFLIATPDAAIALALPAHLRTRAEISDWSPEAEETVRALARDLDRLADEIDRERRRAGGDT